MATQTTQETTRTPELTIITRVASIPLVASSLSTLHDTLTNNALTRQPYTTATTLSKSALGYAEPLQHRFAPLLVRADEYANLGFDAVESRYPYPFKTTPEDIVKDFKTRSDNAKDLANKTIDERVKSPVANVAGGIDQRFAPIVDYFQLAVSKIYPVTNGSAEPAHPETKYQYQRAYALSKELTEQLRTYSTEQLNQLKTHNALVKRASGTAHDISTLASTSYGTAQTKVHTLSDTMLTELHQVRATTAALPAHAQAAFSDISQQLSSTISDLTVILKSEEPVHAKVTKVKETVQERVQPILAAAAARVQEMLSVVRARVGEKTEQGKTVVGDGIVLGEGAVVETVESVKPSEEAAAPVTVANGNGNGHA
ncbi:lipid droplet-associated perilipin protein [Fomitopsis serialis]|uniref:lipid droplet-associated perilipin protein n=1 Tax=Fomitopsis serialis TaxID=139415 RepID=UPI0020079946|nr:lipid droplet-associated perilipin protein [Neoantrodia serialis]KAH9924081.1 lipid droplet-associated perilipin protein [Neoantrodia serialis]